MKPADLILTLVVLGVAGGGAYMLLNRNKAPAMGQVVYQPAPTAPKTRTRPQSPAVNGVSVDQAVGAAKSLFDFGKGVSELFS